MLLLVVSDFHLGSGMFLKNGQRNILEDFHDDDHFQEFTEWYSSEKYQDDDIHLVLNGDIFNLISIEVDETRTHILDEERTLKAFNIIAKGHPKFFDSLKNFLKKPNKKLTFIYGNHDNGMKFKKVQKRFNELVDGEIDFGFYKEINGVHVEHGHRFEAINTVPRDKYFIDGPNGKPILNLPWASLFCIHILPELKQERPHIDKVRPLISYIKWTFFHDTMFFFWLLFKVVGYLISTQFDKYTRQNNNFKTSLKILKQVTVYPKYGQQAWRILRRKSQTIHTVVMGHTHITEWRKYKTGQLYLNSGTWNPIPSVDAGQHENHSKRTYVSIRMDKKNKTVQNACVNNWYGKWSPFREWAYLETDKKVV